MWKMLLTSWFALSFTATLPVKSGDVQLAELGRVNDEITLVPIAIIRQGRLINPVLYRATANEKLIQKFLDQNYKIGSEFYGRRSGVSVGTFQLREFTGGCDTDDTFKAKLMAGAGIKSGQVGLATSRPVGTPHPSYRVVPTSEDRAIFQQVTRAALSKSDRQLTSKTPVVIHTLVSTRASLHGNPLLIGSLSFKFASREAWVFAILEQNAGQWRVALTQVHTIKDLEDRTDAQQEDFLDQLDIDADGNDEIFTDSTYYEGLSYAAYTLRDGIWTRSFESGYGGC